MCTKTSFSKGSDAIGRCAIGSVKSNIGHSESASGMAALTKVMMQMKYRKLAPTIHCEELNSGIIFSSSPFMCATIRGLGSFHPKGW
ncbi:hypothetical protein [Bacillus velezensis]|uniref:hypothetical protein n=1 Tax=Bacillus velezensis TaxID=492670 RepID=UPI0015F67B6F